MFLQFLLTFVFSTALVGQSLTFTLLSYRLWLILMPFSSYILLRHSLHFTLTFNLHIIIIFSFKHALLQGPRCPRTCCLHGIPRSFCSYLVCSFFFSTLRTALVNEHAHVSVAGLGDDAINILKQLGIGGALGAAGPLLGNLLGSNSTRRALDERAPISYVLFFHSEDSPC